VQNFSIYKCLIAFWLPVSSLEKNPTKKTMMREATTKTVTTTKNRTMTATLNEYARSSPTIQPYCRRCAECQKIFCKGSSRFQGTMHLTNIS
jgi:hypothetical protein